MIINETHLTLFRALIYYLVFLTLRFLFKLEVLVVTAKKGGTTSGGLIFGRKLKEIIYFSRECAKAIKHKGYGS